MKVDKTDVAEVLGVAAVTAGVWFVYWPAALIVLGVLLICAAAFETGGQNRDVE